MPLSQYSLNQRRSKFGRIFKKICEVVKVGQVIVDTFHPVFPLGKIGFTDIGVNDKLLFAVADNTGHTAQS